MEQGICKGRKCERNMRKATRIRLLRSRLIEEKKRRIVAERNMMVDPLTGAFNRRGLEAKFVEEASKVRRFGRGMCMLFLDVDNFKKFNSMHGEEAGDSVLRGLVAALKDNLRAYDSVHRIGGEEFVVLLPETASLQHACIVAERLRKVVEGMQVEHSGSVLAVTASIGIAPLEGGMGLQELVNRANQAEMEAKECGKNRVCVFSENGTKPAEAFMRDSKG